MIRSPAVAGRFYSDVPARLREQVDSLLGDRDSKGQIRRKEKIRARACLVPHAGYMYSGRVAGAVYDSVEIPARVILIGPRHYPRGANLAILSDGQWQTPFGPAAIDRTLAEKIALACTTLQENEEAHRTEHSIEVQLPFLQRLAPAVTFVPIVLGTAHYEQLDELGRAIAGVIAAESEPVLLIASSDMNHYESVAVTRVKDRRAIDCMLALDPLALFNTVRKEEISMCGYNAAVVVLTAARQLGSTHAELVRYATSGEVNGDLQEVVGYAGMVMW
jgi:AmmeMemoRadiSam system protein B